MLNLYRSVISKESNLTDLSESEKLSVFYHDLFDFPLNLQELIRWRLAESVQSTRLTAQILYRNGYFFIEGKEGIIYKRTLRKRISAKKIEIAKRASEVLSFVPGILMIALTGSLAMDNADSEGDIDLMIVTKSGMLWITRLLSYLVIKMFGFEIREAGDKNQKDKLCLNIWLDESDLVWQKSDRNLYTAHEIAQIVPLVNKDKTYEKFLYKNRWILNFWPSAVKIYGLGSKIKDKNLHLTPYLLHLISLPVEKLAFKIQFFYMKRKITREIITPTRALFHPQDWGGVVLSRFSS